MCGKLAFFHSSTPVKNNEALGILSKRSYQSKNWSSITLSSGPSIVPFDSAIAEPTSRARVSFDKLWALCASDAMSSKFATTWLYTESKIKRFLHSETISSLSSSSNNTSKTLTADSSLPSFLSSIEPAS